jgi:uncharacterized protein involved in exopolysaccharide biosynthesis
MSKSEEIDRRLTELEPELLDLQQQHQEILVESDRLDRAVSLSRDTYATLARKLEESQISAQEENGILRAGSYAAVPTQAVGPRKAFNSAVAALVGLLCGIALAFSIEFWRWNWRRTPQADSS